MLSIYAGLRVGEIAALTIGDVATQSGDVRREIKLGAHQTKGSKGRTVVLSERVRREIDAYVETQPVRHHEAALMYRSETVAPSPTSRCPWCSKQSTRPKAFEPLRTLAAEPSRPRSMPKALDANHPEADGPSPYRNDGPLLRGFGGDYAECGRSRLSGVPSKGAAVRYSSNCRHAAAPQYLPLWAIPDLTQRSKHRGSFDHLIGAQQEGR